MATIQELLGLSPDTPIKEQLTASILNALSPDKDIGRETFDRSVIPQAIQQSIPPVPEFVQPGIGSAIGQGMGAVLNYPAQFYQTIGQKANESLRNPALQNTLQTITGKPTAELFGDRPTPTDPASLTTRGEQLPRTAQFVQQKGETESKRVEGEESDKKKKFWLLAAKYGIPVASAIVGSTVPGALPGASGFTQGFVGETSRQQQLKEKATATQKATEADLAKTVLAEDAKIRLKAVERKLDETKKLTNAELLKLWPDAKKAGGQAKKAIAEEIKKRRSEGRL